MPEYDIKRADEIDRKGGRAKYILSTCPKCATQRYVHLRDQSTPGVFANTHCKKCNPRWRGKEFNF